MDLTDEQIHDMWLQFKHFHPDKVKSTTIVDEEFDEFEKELEEETKGVLYDTTQIVPHGATAPVFVTETPPEAIPDEWEDV